MIKGTDIREARNRAGLSQEELAAKVGVTLRTIGNWERSTTVPREKESVLRTILGDHLDAGEASSPRLRVASHEELLHEVARRLARADQKEGQAHGTTPAKKITSAEAEQVGPRGKVKRPRKSPDTQPR